MGFVALNPLRTPRPPNPFRTPRPPGRSSAPPALRLHFWWTNARGEPRQAWQPGGGRAWDVPVLCHPGHLHGRARQCADLRWVYREPRGTNLGFGIWGRGRGRGRDSESNPDTNRIPTGPSLPGTTQILLFPSPTAHHISDNTPTRPRRRRPGRAAA